MDKKQIIKTTELVENASKQWQSAFNAGDAAGCAAMYEKTAVMTAKPLGVFEGRHDIQDFWQMLIDEGYSEVTYQETQIEVIDAERARLSANWKMNQAQGVIHQEIWAIQEDGSARLREDNFEVLESRP